MSTSVQPHREPAVLGRAVVDPAGWAGSELAASGDWVFELSADEAASLIEAAHRIRGVIGDEPNRLLATTAGDFDLGAFTPTLRRLAVVLKDGRGIGFVRGLPLETIDLLDVAVIYWGIGRHLGTAVSNNPEGDMLGHVVDKGKDLHDPRHRGYQTNETMHYHCDQSGIVGLLCVHEPRLGGTSKVASSIAVYNEMLRRRPDLVQVLAAPYCWSMHGEVDPGEKGYFESPVFNFIDGYLCVALGPSHILKGHKVLGAPEMTPLQREALMVMETICEELHYGMTLRRGDMQFLNNAVALHTRTAFEDWDEPRPKRRLWRLWVNNPAVRPLTPYHQHYQFGVRIASTRPRIVLVD